MPFFPVQLLLRLQASCKWALARLAFASRERLAASFTMAIATAFSAVTMISTVACQQVNAQTFSSAVRSKAVSMGSDSGSQRHVTKRSALLLTLAEEPVANDVFRNELRRTAAVINDSRLNDVCSVGRFCWAVGENGVILASDDSGANFTESILPFPCSLNSVCFLTNQIGYVAGSRFDLRSGWQKAVLMKTLDGGRSWDDLTATTAVLGAMSVASSQLPSLAYVRFFDLENGVCIAEKSRSSKQAGIYRTSDGGESWTLLKASGKAGQGDITPEWSRACFISAEQGIVVGQQNATGTVIANQLVVLAPARRTLQAIHDVTIHQDGTGWMVGDAASILKSTDGGLTWRTVDHAVDSDLTHIWDFTSVCVKDSTVLVAGRQGSRIFRSDDSGQTWASVPTSQSLPLHRLTFTGTDSVVGIGAMGLVIRSDDRGQSWTAVRNSDYRAAVASFVTEISDVPQQLLANLSSHEGFRSVVIQASMKQDRGTASDLEPGRVARRRLAQLAVNDLCQDWMFARPNPEHAERSDEVLTSWQRQTDGQVIQQLPDRLAMWIRTWRPDVICIDPINDTDGVAQWIRQALPMACQIAANEVPVSAAMTKSGMPAWSVSRIVEKTFDGRTSALSYSENDLLPAANTTVGLLTTRLRRSLSDSPTLVSTESLQQSTADGQTASYRLVLSRSAGSATSHLLAGFMAAPGSNARRTMSSADSGREQRMQKVLRTVVQQNGIARSRIHRNDAALGLIAELSQMNRDLPPALAIQQMEHLVQTYRGVGNLDGQISVLKELVRRYPESEAAVRASVELFQYFSSAELRRLRKQKVAVQATQIHSKPDSTIQQVRADQRQEHVNRVGGILKSVKEEVGHGRLLNNRIASEQEALDIQWNRNAADALKHIRNVAPDVLSTAAIRFQQAALLRSTGQIGKASNLLSEISRSNSEMSSLAAAEIGVSNGAMISDVRILNIPPTEKKPWLDARLDDDCWIKAEELHLKATQQADGRSYKPCLVMMSWDDDHLYFAGRIDRIAAKPLAIDESVDRLRDTSHQGIDRFELALDVDRDYSSALVLKVDERGQTSDACWHDRSWNPEWFVATESDETSWRFEIAIPISELVDRPVRPGQLWSIRMTRTAPGICRQVLVPKDQEFAGDQDDGIGLLRFIRRKK